MKHRVARYSEEEQWGLHICGLLGSPENRIPDEVIQQTENMTEVLNEYKLSWKKR
jgi:hypothetical protein